ncbi:hypothetical protein DSO57_1021923 [Entomophthora muscae]|uniref:Uncharacterized protein n=1 Tax=Entomophthora muscae TaxID=34485 RepID=A0ACC2UC87_9FUNG|nr:hypothetical protein DSO57_1021923 [Entomophthora muscae]
MTPPLTPRPDLPLEPNAAAKTTSTQLFGVLYITLTGLVDSMVSNSGPWSLLRQSVSYIIKLAPILWWALPASLAATHPEPPNASTYDWLPENYALPMQFGKLLLAASAIVLENKSYDLLVGTQFLRGYNGIINLKDIFLSILEYKVPLIFEEPVKVPRRRLKTCALEYPTGVFTLNTELVPPT